MTSVKARKRKKRDSRAKTEARNPPDDNWLALSISRPFALLSQRSFLFQRKPSSSFSNPFAPSQTIHCRFLNLRGVLILDDRSYLVSSADFQTNAFLWFILGLISRANEIVRIRIHDFGVQFYVFKLNFGIILNVSVLCVKLFNRKNVSELQNTTVIQNQPNFSTILNIIRVILRITEIKQNVNFECSKTYDIL